jgi:hypothetical protein
VKKSSPTKKPYVIVRTYSAGVFAGTLESRTGQEVVLSDARRIWKWDGAASLSGLAVHGTSNPSGCMFPAAVPQVVLTQAIEIISTTPQGQASIEAVPEWKK